MREWSSLSDDLTLKDGSTVKEYTIGFKTTEYDVYKRIERFFQSLMDEPNSSEKPNNCETCSHWWRSEEVCLLDECQYEPKTDYTPDCPFCRKYGTEDCLGFDCRHYKTYKDELQKWTKENCKGCKYNEYPYDNSSCFVRICINGSKYTPKTEHSGEVTEMVEPQIIACPIQDDDAWIYETEPQTERRRVMTTVYCTAYGCKHNKPHDADYGICERDCIILDTQVDLVFEGCPDYEEERSE